MNPYPFQREAVDSLYDWFYDNPQGNPLIVAPTGSGKSFIIALFIKEAIEQWPNTRILMLTHVKELIMQNALRLVDLWPDAPLGIYSAGLKKADTFCNVIFAGIQSVYKRADDLGHFDLIIVDEAHLIAVKERGIYRRFLTAAMRINPDLRIIGLTATPWRNNYGHITQGDYTLFNAVAYEINLLQLINDGYLSPLTTKVTKNKLDVSDVRIDKGDFITADLEKAIDQSSITNAVLEEAIERGRERKHWLVFCVSVQHAEHVAFDLDWLGITAKLITGKTDQTERDAAIADYRSGKIQALVTVGVLTTGFDAPETDLLVILRPTKSPVLYVQMLGRGMRIAPDKTDCLVLDFAGNILEHGPVDYVYIKQKKPGMGLPPIKKCPVCQLVLHIKAPSCPECGHIFLINKSKDKLTEQPTEAPVLSTQQELKAEPVITEFTIHHCDYIYHSNPNKPLPSLRVEYYEGFSGPPVAKEWICFEHQGYARRKAVLWWQQRLQPECEYAVPNTVIDALELPLSEILKTPSSISVRTIPGEKYSEIVKATFEATNG